MFFTLPKMEKKGDLPVPNLEPEFKGNKIFCFGLKKCTFVIGYLGIAFLLLIGVTGTVGAFEFGFNIFEQGEHVMTHEDALDLCKLLWMFVGLGVLMHTLLLVGNTMDERTFLLGWLTMTWVWLSASTWALASSVAMKSPFETVVKLVLYGVTMGFPLFIVHRRYNELSAWDRKRVDLEDGLEDSIHF